MDFQIPAHRPRGSGRASRGGSRSEPLDRGFGRYFGHSLAPRASPLPRGALRSLGSRSGHCALVHDALLVSVGQIEKKKKRRSRHLPQPQKLISRCFSPNSSRDSPQRSTPVVHIGTRAPSSSPPATSRRLRARAPHPGARRRGSAKTSPGEHSLDLTLTIGRGRGSPGRLNRGRITRRRHSDALLLTEGKGGRGEGKGDDSSRRAPFSYAASARVCHRTDYDKLCSTSRPPGRFIPKERACGCGLRSSSAICRDLHPTSTRRGLREQASARPTASAPNRASRSGWRTSDRGARAGLPVRTMPQARRHLDPSATSSHEDARTTSLRSRNFGRVERRCQET